MKSITVMIVYDDGQGNTRSQVDILRALSKAAITVIQLGTPDLDDMPNVTALRGDDGELLGTITRS